MALSKYNGSFCFKENMSFSNVIENHVLGTKYVKKKNSSTTVQQSQHYSKTSSLWGLITKETFTRTPVEGEHDSESDSEEEDIKPSSSGVLYRQSVQLCYSRSFVQNWTLYLDRHSLQWLYLVMTILANVYQYLLQSQKSTRHFCCYCCLIILSRWTFQISCTKSPHTCIQFPLFNNFKVYSMLTFTFRYMCT